ncbi:MAG: hypothetical protein ACTIJY_10060, partial [Luteimonas sp.]
PRRPAMLGSLYGSIEIKSLEPRRAKAGARARARAKTKTQIKMDARFNRHASVESRGHDDNEFW